MASKSGLSASDLAHAAKALNHTESPSDSKGTVLGAEDKEAIAALEEIYERFEGNLDLIFAELKSDPTKAKKPHNRPENAAEFARKFYEGFYTLTEHHLEADSKHHK